MSRADSHHRDVERLLPLKDLVFRILLALHDGERHGYSIVKKIRERPSGRRPVAPGQLYRTLATMLELGLIEESDRRPDPELDDERRRYFRLTAFGRRAAGAEARRLEELVASARRHRILEQPGGAS
jgi:DNA-binding PadR family transcriptional regulator